MKAIIGISNRHVHLMEEDYKKLFGDIPMNKAKDLVQTGEFASDLKVSIKTEKNEIKNVRVLGPLRKYTQVEISKTDSFQLGVNPPIRTSGELENAAIVTIIGPNGEVTKPCCIIANRHLHIDPKTREELGLVGVEKVCVEINSEKSAILKDVFVKETPNGVLEFHMDTDDGNATLAKTGEYVTIIK